MALVSSEAPPRTGSPAGPAQRPLDVLVVGALAVVALLLAGVSGAHHLQAVPHLALALAGTLVLFVVAGDALARWLVPREWGPYVPLCSLPLGAVSSGLILTALGYAHVPLKVSLWLLLAAGVAASVLVRRRLKRPALGTPERRRLLLWTATALILLAVALLPAWRLGSDTIYGQNPDAAQVVGVAVLFQHVPPTATDVALPLDVVPPAWRFRYPIFYALAGASNLSHSDPILVFPAMSAVLMVICALGFALLAVKYLDVPDWAGPLVAGVIGLSWIILHSGWHPYWNQLWGLALFPWALLFGWRAVADRDGRAAALFVLTLVMLELAYPLALPYPLVVVAGLLVGYGRRPRMPQMSGKRGWVALVLVICVLAPAVIAAAVKLVTAIGQIVSANSALWGGDVKTLIPLGWFAGTGGGWLPALGVLALAGFAVWRLPRRLAISLSVVMVVLLLLDIRFRTASTGAYMDYKHLSFVGLLVLTLAASGAIALIRSPRRWVAVTGLVLAAGWMALAGHRDRLEVYSNGEQVPPQMFQVRGWLDRLGPGATVRIDIPPSGWQLWAVYMAGAHPVDAPQPVLATTYAYAPYGLRAQYSLAFSHIPTPSGPQPMAAVPPYAVNPPLAENSRFALRRINWPARLHAVPQTASQALVEP